MQRNQSYPYGASKSLLIKEKLVMYNMQKVIQNSIKKYLIHGARSNKKITMLHDFIGKSITDKLPENYNYFSLHRSEISVPGKFYNKKVDVCIKNEDDITGTVSVKFVMSNFCQNSNNYFENLIGEMYNLKETGPRLYVMVLFEDIPYYDKSGDVIRYERFKDMARYDSLTGDGIISDYIIIKVSNGKTLTSPVKREGVNLDCSRFEIISEYPQSYEKCIEQFSLKLKNKTVI